MQKKTYEELDFTDDFMFCKVLADNPDICKELLELILGIKIRKVIVNKQEAISITADAKSVRFDVYAEDDKNTVFDVEMETTRKKNLPKRSRYYHGMIDLNILQKGADYNELKKSYVIFICLTDPFQEGFPVYTFENRCVQKLDMSLGDDAIKVFINASGNVEGVSMELADFLSYLRTGIGDSSLVQKIDAEVRKARAHEEWKVEYMTWQLKFHDIWDDARDEGYDEGYGEGYDNGMKKGLAGLARLVEKGVISPEIAANEADITVEEFLRYTKSDEA